MGIITVNNFLFSQIAPDLEVVDAYSRVIDTDGQIKPGYVYDDIHPNAMGAFEIMVPLEALLTAKYGTRQYMPHPGNILSNTNFSGSNGSISVSRENGVLADGHNTTGSAPSGMPLTRTYAKDTGQIMAFDFPAGGSTRDNMRLYTRLTGNYASQSVYYECEFRILDSGAGNGIWAALSAEILTSSGSQLATAYDRNRDIDPLPITALAGFCTAKGGRTLILRTPVVMIPTSTYVDMCASISRLTP